MAERRVPAVEDYRAPRDAEAALGDLGIARIDPAAVLPLVDDGGIRAALAPKPFPHAFADRDDPVAEAVGEVVEQPPRGLQRAVPAAVAEGGDLIVEHVEDPADVANGPAR